MKVDLEGQVEGHWVENEEGQLELVVTGKHPEDRVAVTAECIVVQ